VCTSLPTTHVNVSPQSIYDMLRLAGGEGISGRLRGEQEIFALPMCDSVILLGAEHQAAALLK
jgi:hypothetical protein